MNGIDADERQGKWIAQEEAEVELLLCLASPALAVKADLEASRAPVFYE